MKSSGFGDKNGLPPGASPAEPYRAASPAVEVNGETVRAMIDGLSWVAPKAKKILSAQGISDPQPGQWYSQQAWLNAFQEIADTLGPNALFLIGYRILEAARFPPHIRTIEEALAAINVAYQMNHRGGEIGSYDYVATGPRSAKIVCRNPYPSDFDRGIIQAVAHRFRPEFSHLAIDIDFLAPSRKSGGGSCTFLVSW
jgi:hypothetical protein